MEDIKLEEIAKELGCTVEDLLASGKTADVIIEEYKSNNLKVLLD